ncbi:hypothetical protein QA584_21980 [Anaerocolumna sp. AGMB13025]|uniref:hypothetical protein n=1 Tax=Anaerocolumna sp. AGMB13025 TaxID=3039116 RepID=UPI00241C3A7D|nr:hypothetical protein [Anaerocolumna sp. AGMB13025]WFR56259.1 hypothetical protein QA584_21980 [Anaerocolumna sp. AGMB13025]
MNNTFVILLYKLFELEIMREEFYGNLSASVLSESNYAFKNTAKILAAEEKKRVDSYRKAVKKSEAEEEYVIDNGIMGEVEYALINLKQSISSYGIITAGQLIAKAIDTQNKQIFLITHILDLLNEKRPSFATEILNTLLQEEQKHLKNLMPFNKM